VRSANATADCNVRGNVYGDSVRPRNYGRYKNEFAGYRGRQKRLTTLHRGQLVKKLFQSQKIRPECAFATVVICNRRGFWGLNVRLTNPVTQKIKHSRMLLHGFENHTRYRIKAGKYAGESEH
jgi:hypothetical protein